MTGSIHYERYKNLPLNCEYEFELFVEFNERFHKAALINADLLKTQLNQTLNIIYFV